MGSHRVGHDWSDLAAAAGTSAVLEVAGDKHPVLELVAFLPLSTSKQLVSPCPPLICFSSFSRAGPLILRESSHGVCAHNFALISFKIRREKK